MLQTIQVEIDASGHIHPLEPLNFVPVGRALLTLLGSNIDIPSLLMTEPAQSSAASALRLLDSPRFKQRPIADPQEVQQRIEALRGDWND